MNTTALTTRRDSFDRNTSAFSPSMDYSSAPGTVRKWPTTNYGALSTVTASSPIAPITPPPASGLGPMVSRAPGAETKYRTMGGQMAPVGLTANSTMFGSSNSLFSKIPGSVARPNPVPSNVVAAEKPAGRSRLLEDFRNQRYPNLQLRDLTNHIVEFSQVNFLLELNTI